MSNGFAPEFGGNIRERREMDLGAVFLSCRVFHEPGKQWSAIADIKNVPHENPVGIPVHEFLETKAKGAELQEEAKTGCNDMNVCQFVAAMNTSGAQGRCV